MQRVSALTPTRLVCAKLQGMEFVAFILAAYWRQLLALLLVVVVGKWIAAHALLVVSIAALVLIALFWLAPSRKPASVYPCAEINPDLLQRLEAYKAGERA